MSADYERLTQKILCLILLASVSRISEVENISHTSRDLHSLASLSSVWVPSFSPKTLSPLHQPSCPSIGFLSNADDSASLLCPVRAYRIYHARSSSWLHASNPSLPLQFLWTCQRNSCPASFAYLSGKFKDLVTLQAFSWPYSRGCCRAPSDVDAQCFLCPSGGPE